MDNSLATASIACAIQLDELSAILREQACTNRSNLSPTDVEDQSSRFRVWAGNLGAFQRLPAASSLDYRLRDSPRIAGQVHELLQDLTSAIEDVSAIASGDKPNRYHEVGDDEYEAASEDGRSVQDGDDDYSGPETLCEAQELFEIIKETLTSLFRIAVVIRNSSPRDRFAKATSRHNPFEQSFDISHVHHKFPKLDSVGKEWLKQRLGNAITQRRHYLCYAREHREKLGKEANELRTARASAAIAEVIPRNLDGISQNAKTIRSRPVSTLAPTAASTLLLPDAPVANIDVDDDQSQTSFAISFGENENEEVLKLPRLSDVSNGQISFECPLCWTMQSIQTENSWTKHALSDLRPYVCTFEACDMKLFKGRKEWFQHEMNEHRAQWHCPFCNNDFALIEKFRSHIHNIHGPDIDKIQMDALAKASQLPISAFSAMDCPFCNEWDSKLREINPSIGVNENLMVTPVQFRRHVASHMQDLALFAIPRGYLELGETDDASMFSIRAADGNASSMSAKLSGSVASTKSRGSLYSELNAAHRQDELENFVEKVVFLQRLWRKRRQLRRIRRQNELPRKVISLQRLWREKKGLNRATNEKFLEKLSNNAGTLVSDASEGSRLSGTQAEDKRQSLAGNKPVAELHDLFGQKLPSQSQDAAPNDPLRGRNSDMWAADSEEYMWPSISKPGLKYDEIHTAFSAAPTIQGYTLWSDGATTTYVHEDCNISVQGSRTAGSNTKRHIRERLSHYKVFQEYPGFLHSMLPSTRFSLFLKGVKIVEKEHIMQDVGWLLHGKSRQIVELDTAIGIPKKETIEEQMTFGLDGAFLDIPSFDEHYADTDCEIALINKRALMRLLESYPGSVKADFEMSVFHEYPTLKEHIRIQHHFNTTWWDAIRSSPSSSSSLSKASEDHSIVRRILETSLNFPVLIGMRDPSDGYRALDIASEKNDRTLATILLQYGARPHSKTLYLAVKSLSYNVLGILLDVEDIQLVVDTFSNEWASTVHPILVDMTYAETFDMMKRRLSDVWLDDGDALPSPQAHSRAPSPDVAASDLHDEINTYVSQEKNSKINNGNEIANLSEGMIKQDISTKGTNLAAKSSKEDERTALDIAIDEGNVEMVRLLLLHGGLLNPIFSMTAFERAFLSRNTDIVELFLDHGFHENDIRDPNERENFLRFADRLWKNHRGLQASRKDRDDSAAEPQS